MALENPVAIFTANSNNQAHEVRVILAHAGIEAHVTEDLSIVGLWAGGFLPGIHTPKVWVDSADTQRAADLVLEYEQREAERAAERWDEDEESEEDEDSCLACGETIPEESDCCPACGWSYGEDQPHSSEQQ